MYKEDMSVYRAIISDVNQTTKQLYVRIPHVLGASESVAVHVPTAAQFGWTWDPAVGDQVLVAVEGTEFDKVYLVTVL